MRLDEEKKKKQVTNTKTYNKDNERAMILTAIFMEHLL